MNSSRIPHVKDVYFQHKVPSCIHGQPTYSTLKVLLDELKANTSSIPTTLGRDMYGHLSLLLSAAQYTTLLNTPFTRPLNPGVFNPPLGTSPQIEAAKEVWCNAHFTFKLSQATEKVLIT